MTEIWKPFKYFEGVAEVSNLGNVRTVDSIRCGIRSGKPHEQKIKGRSMSPHVGRNGYLTVAFKVGKTRKKALVHRAVGHAFVEGHFEGATINHKNGIKTDNRWENLEWCTRSDNTKHQWLSGLVNLRGEKHPQHKMTDTNVEQALKMLSSSFSVKDVAQHFRVSETLIYKIRSGKKRYRTTKPLLRSMAP